MNRPEALAVLRTVAGRLEPDAAGCARLLERISTQAEAELLRDVLVELGARALLDDSPDVDDPGQAVRLRMEAERDRVLEDVDAVAAALDVVERAAGQVAAATLPVFAERLGRAFGRAMARMQRETREAVRAAVRVDR